jgi:hypothetical protein
MKTLIIHPKDKSTEFLKPIYENIENTTILIGGLYDCDYVSELIETHDQVIMLGHGTSRGLLSVGQFPNCGAYVINSVHVDLLAKKENNIYIWCYASDFVKEHNLKGFASGMFISEVEEAEDHLLTEQTQEHIDESNHYFSELVGKVSSLPANEIYEFVKERYKLITYHNSVAAYNYERLYLKS